MRLFTTAVVVLLALAINVRAEDDKKDKDKGKIDKSKLVGTWKMTKTDSDDPPPREASITVEFTKDGKVVVVFGLMCKELKMNGTYKIEGDKLSTTMKSLKDNKDKTDTMTIKELTAKKLVTVEKKKGDKTETTEFEKSK